MNVNIILCLSLYVMTTQQLCILFDFFHGILCYYNGGYTELNQCYMCVIIFSLCRSLLYGEVLKLGMSD